MPVKAQDATAGEAVDGLDHGSMVRREEGPDRGFVGGDDRGRDQVGEPQRQQVLAASSQPAWVIDHGGATGIDEIQDQRGIDVGLVEWRFGAHEDRCHLIQPDPLRLGGGEPAGRHGPAVTAARPGRREPHPSGARSRSAVRGFEQRRFGDPDLGATVLGGMHEAHGGVDRRIQ